MIDLPSVAKYVTAVGVIAGAAISAETRYAPASAVAQIQSDLRVDRIFNLANEARANGSPEWICTAIDRELVALCTEVPDHYLCAAEARRELKEKAGC